MKKNIITITLICGLAHLAFSQNMGINQASPTSKLDVGGSIAHTGTLRSRGPNYTSTWMQFDEHVNGNSLILGAGGLTAIGGGESANQVKGNIAESSESLYLSSDGEVRITTNVNGGWASRVDAVTILGNGNFGIGTTAPSQKLDVEGSVRIRGGGPAVGEVLMATSADGTAAWSSVPQIFDDMGDHTATTTLDMSNQNITPVGILSMVSGSTYDKLRVWNSASNTIGMHSGMSFGWLADYAMTFTMDNNTDRGFIWRDDADAVSDGAMSLTTDGRLRVKNYTRFDSYIGVGTDPDANYNIITGTDLAYGIQGYGTTMGGRFEDVNSSARVYCGYGSYDVYANGTGRIDALTQMQAPIYYDLNNNGYYMDPAGLSIFNDLREDIFYDMDNTAFYMDQASTSYFNDMRASIFYDQDNTGYYLNPFTSNRMNEILADNGSPTDVSYYFAGDANTGLYQPANNELGISTNGIESMRIDASGQVGIGVADPLTTLHVADANGQSLMLERTDAGITVNEQLGGIGFDGSDGNTPSDIRESSASIIALAAETHGPGDKGGHLTFWTSPLNQDDNTDGLERIRIEENGEVGIGTTAPTATLSVNGTANKTGGGNWATFSDRRVKRDIVPYEDGLAEVLKINPVKFKFIEEFAIPADKDKEFVGVIAQDIKEIAPYMVESYKYEYDSENGESHVVENGQELYMYDPSALDYMLVNAVKEQQQMLEAGDRRLEEVRVEDEQGREEIRAGIAEVRIMISDLQQRSLKNTHR